MKWYVERKMKVLIEMKHGLGDCVCMIPAIRWLRHCYPQADISLLVNGSANQAIFEHGKLGINNFYYLSLKGRTWTDTLQTILHLRKERFDIGILATMTPSRKGKILFKILGIGQCLGEQYKGIHFLDLDNKIHFVDRNIEVFDPLYTCKMPQDWKSPRLYLFADDGRNFEWLLKRKRKGIAVNIGGADKNYYKGKYVYTTRNWGIENMKRLISYLVELPYDIYLVGGALEEPLLADLGNILHKGNVLNFVNKTSIDDTMFILKHSALSIGVDTGMQHVADALGIPTLSIFGPTNPMTHGAYSSKADFIQCTPLTSCQYCFGSDAYYTCPNKKCMVNVSPEKVFEKTKQLLQR